MLIADLSVTFRQAQPSTTFPLIILLGLLERPALLKTPSMMDSLTTLLASVTRSLSVLQKKPKSADPASNGEPASSTVATAGGEAAPTPATSGADAAPSTTADQGKEKEKDSDELPSADILLKTPPQIPDSSLRLVVNVLDAGECSSRTFSQTLTLIQNLSHLDSGRSTILDELKVRADKISNDLIPDLKELLETISRDETVSSATLSKFTPASSSQAKLLRILKTIDFFGTAPKKTGKSTSEKALSPEEEQVKALYSQLASSDLWRRLGDALGGIEAKPELLYLSTVLLPLIESLLVVNKFTDSSSTEFIDFTTAHSKILNTMVRNNPSLMSGSFAVLVRNSTMLDFENKRSVSVLVPCTVLPSKMLTEAGSIDPVLLLAPPRPDSASTRPLPNDQPQRETCARFRRLVPRPPTQVGRRDQARQAQREVLRRGRCRCGRSHARMVRRPRATNVQPRLRALPASSRRCSDLPTEQGENSSLF